ncbi:Transmembrane protein [Orchesella cincta]|uniref:Transmembrane protein n=1 Tax=Orchesella cincta TaxID=48709 RepID=A0A1D2N052_ORCCI|nr:Transmembrane protein [Orchesella cincta]
MSYRCYKAVLFITGFSFGLVIVALICQEEDLLPQYGNIAKCLAFMRTRRDFNSLWISVWTDLLVGSLCWVLHCGAPRWTPWRHCVNAIFPCWIFHLDFCHLSTRYDEPSINYYLESYHQVIHLLTFLGNWL